MSYRASQNPSYWTTDFRLTPEDVEVLEQFLEKRERPVPETDLVPVLVESRFQREDQRIRRELSRGTPYQPRDSYEVGQVLVFPASNFALGTVLEKRSGKNPEHGDFDVVKVQMEGESTPRSFAASLQTPHKLNRKDGDDGMDQGDVLGPEELGKRYGKEVRTELRDALEALDDSPFVHLGPYWSLRSLLVDVHVGHLNIAEALMDVQNHPVPTAEILPELDLPQEIPLALAAFSLDMALAQDGRFVDVGTDSREWYLERLMPEEATEVPRRLQHQEDEYDRSLLTVPLLQMEWELDDEWTEGGPTSVSVATMPSVTLTLTYPHRRSGTVPLTDRTSSFFPVREGKRSMITFVDGRWGKRFPGWVMPEGRYVCGLGQWYEEHEIPVGAYIVLERTQDSAEIVVDFKPRRMKREWVRMARIEEGQLAFQLQKQAIACEYDEVMIVAEAEPAETDELRRKLYRRGPSVNELLEELAPQLMGLSTQGTVHAKTLYSAINLVRRTAPGPIFAALVGNPRFHDVGGGYFAIARS